MTDTQFKVVVGPDYDGQNPADFDVFRVVSFGRNHVGYKDPSVVLACRFEYDDELDEDGSVAEYGYQCDEWPGDVVHQEGHEDFHHKYQGDPDIICYLSYFEHGLCKWGRRGTMSGMPDFRWDGVSLAGVLMFDPTPVYLDRPDEIAKARKWWDTMDEKAQHEQIDTFLRMYTDWCNGWVHVLSFEKYVERDPNPCPTCDRPRAHSGWEQIDCLGGIYGLEGIEEQVKEWADSEGIDPSDIKLEEIG